jgi:general secretion pathway protein G
MSMQEHTTEHMEGSFGPKRIAVPKAPWSAAALAAAFCSDFKAGASLPHSKKAAVSLPQSKALRAFPRNVVRRRFMRSSLKMTGFTFVELMASITIILLLTTIALPLARVQIQRTKEVELRRDLREMREAIDRHKDFADRGMIPVKADTFGYPPDLETLVEGVTLKGTATAKYKFLRKLPVDPMTGTADWGMRSMEDDPDSRSWGGQNVFDVYSKSDGTALDGTKYSDW